MFISYSWSDLQTVNSVIDYLQENFDIIDIAIDRKSIIPGSSIACQITKEIYTSDYVLVFLSSQSVKSNWVIKEINETLISEIINKRSILIPIKLEDCNIPENIAERLYIDFTNKSYSNLKQSIHSIVESKQHYSINHNFYQINIKEPNFEMYHTGEYFQWQTSLKFHEAINSYVLFNVDKSPNKPFKNYIVCKRVDMSSIISIVSNTLQITPTVNYLGDMCEIWFIDPKYPFVGVGDRRNNKWEI